MLHLDEGEWIDDQPSWPAFVDLLAASALLFVTLVAVLAYAAERQAIALRGQADGVRTQLDTLIAHLGQGSQNGTLYQVESDSQLIRVVIQADVTFPRNAWAIDSIQPAGRAALMTIGQILRAAPTRGLYRQVIVTGHTDQTAFKAGAAITNWELSSVRAASVARFLVDSSDLNPCALGAAGRGAYFPNRSVAHSAIANRDSVAMRQNRRIEIEIIPALVSRATDLSGCYPQGDHVAR